MRLNRNIAIWWLEAGIHLKNVEFKWSSSLSSSPSDIIPMLISVELAIASGQVRSQPLIISRQRIIALSSATAASSSHLISTTSTGSIVIIVIQVFLVARRITATSVGWGLSLHSLGSFQGRVWWTLDLSFIWRRSGSGGRWTLIGFQRPKQHSRRKKKS